MFTGLVTTTGTLARREASGPGARLGVRARLTGGPIELGESIAVDGCCLSVVTVAHDVIEFDATSETLGRTTLGALEVGASVHLERAVAAGDRLGGHLVTGHVDGVGHLNHRHDVGDAASVRFSLPPSLTRFVAEKGSIAVHGVSLTVNAVGADWFEVMLIPITLAATKLGRLAPGDPVNLEVDLVARYVARLFDAARAPSDGPR